MKIVETSVTADAIRMLLADGPDAASAKEWIEIQLLRSNLKIASRQAHAPDLDGLSLQSAQITVLENARAALGDEIARLQSPQGPRTVEV